MFYFPFYQPPCLPIQPFVNPASSLQRSQAPVSNQASLDRQQLERIQHQVWEETIILDKDDLLAAGYVKTRRLWSEEEDKLLLQLKDKKKMKFDEISKRMPGRNVQMCTCRYRRISIALRHSWLKKDDQNLLRYVQQLGEDWVEIARRFQRRNAAQVKHRYTNFLKPGNEDREWTLQQDLRLIELINLYGKQWDKLMKQLNRSSLQIKNRFYGRIRKLNLRKWKNKKLMDSVKSQ